VHGDGTREKLRKLITFAGGSAVATVCSEGVLLLTYGVLHFLPTVSSVLAWLAGAIPNYWLGRRWTWRRTGRPHLTGEVLPYAAVVLFTLALAVLTTHTVAVELKAANVDRAHRAVIVAAAFLGVYVVMFLVRFWLLNRLFARLHRRDHSAPADAAGTREAAEVPLEIREEREEREASRRTR
jgi:putative flippase GtrA